MNEDERILDKTRRDLKFLKDQMEQIERELPPCQEEI